MYDEYYGLTGRPFQLTPDHRFFFNSPGHTRALAYLRYGLEQGEGFIVISGGIGTGKTMLVLTLFDELEGRDVLAGQLVTTQVGPEDLLRMVCASFGLPNDGLSKAALLQNLHAFASARFGEGRRILLVVDEAHNLPPASLEELRMLANFQVQGRSLFQSFLLGQDELRRTLQGPGMEQLRQRVIAAHHLEPLTLEETRAYIEYRLACVNWSGSPALDDGVFERVHQICAGVPRRINTLCDRLFLFGCIEEKLELDADDVDVVAAEIRSEVGRVGSAATSDNGVQLETLASGSERRGGSGQGGDSLPGRLAFLEEEVAALQRTVKRERQLLRKAILLQLDLSAYDDVD